MFCWSIHTSGYPRSVGGVMEPFGTSQTADFQDSLTQFEAWTFLSCGEFTDVTVTHYCKQTRINRLLCFWIRDPLIKALTPKINETNVSGWMLLYFQSASSDWCTRLITALCCGWQVIYQQNQVNEIHHDSHSEEALAQDEACRFHQWSSSSLYFPFSSCLFSVIAAVMLPLHTERQLRPSGSH